MHAACIPTSLVLVVLAHFINTIVGFSCGFWQDLADVACKSWNFQGVLQFRNATLAMQSTSGSFTVLQSESTLPKIA